MTRRKVQVDGKEYKYVVGKMGIKIDGVGYFPLTMGRYIDGNDVAVTPNDIRRRIEVHKLENPSKPKRP